MANPFNEDGSLTCDICGKGLWGGPLGHLPEEWYDCNVKLQERVKKLNARLRKYEMLEEDWQRMIPRP